MRAPAPSPSNRTQLFWCRCALDPQRPEAYLTVLLENLWPKKRILEAYLNLVDWGDGIFGAEAAANAYFGTDAGSLNDAQAARLAAILPNPHKWKAAHSGRYVRRRIGLLQGRSAMVTRDGLNFCVK
jgi:monofunctional biosynthetic peptidoglycan transglycosylase